MPIQLNTIYINFIAEINDKTTSLLLYILTEQLRAGVNSFRINISSGGGLVNYSVSIFNFLNGLTNITIHTHNLGQIDSGANLIFLAGQKRTASKASTFLLHPPQMNFQGQGLLGFSIETLRERLNSLEKDQHKMAEIISSKINRSTEDIVKMFNERKTYSSSEAKELGFISEIDDFVASPGLPIFSITNQS
jgi:ATP-dependent protease ClpP protease subunit